MSVDPRHDAAFDTRDVSPEILSAIEPEVTTRIRIEHSKTIKEGWGYSTTVEATFRGESVEADAAAVARLGGLLETVWVIAERERDIRNERAHQEVRP